MAGKYKWCSFSDVDLSDGFFDSLKNDYPEFPQWFAKKKVEEAKSLVFSDEAGIGAFLYLKVENEQILLSDNHILPAINRLKIGTLRIAERQRGMRLGEGAIGVALWHWQLMKVEEIYVTIFEKHELLISLFERFGFLNMGYNDRHERIYIKNRNNIDYSSPYTAFPFISPDFKVAGIIPINDYYHDSLFPYSDLKGVKELEEDTAKNGIKKVFIATPSSELSYKPGEPVFIYRVHTGDGQKTYKSVITSFCTVTSITIVKTNWHHSIDFDNFLFLTGNKTVYEKDKLKDIYTTSKNVILVEMIYNGFFGKGHNVTNRELVVDNLFPSHPYNIKYTKDQFCKILKMGDADEHNIIVDKS